MNPKEESQGIWTPAWPGRRAALLRLLLITSVVFPLSWVVNALLVGSWNLLGDRNAESVRHLIEWQVIWIATVAVVFLVSLLPGPRRFLGRFNPRRWFFALVCFATLIVLFYAVENWRGARAWNKYRQELEARGVELDFAAFIPKPIPDEQNFAATPLVQSWFEKGTPGNAHQWGDAYEQVDKQLYASGAGEQPGTNNRQFMDLVGWAAAFGAVRAGETNVELKFDSGKVEFAARAKAAPVVLDGLKTSEAVLAELRAASLRPRSQYPVKFNLDDPWSIMLPHLLNVRYACRRLQLKACAELAAGRSDAALADVEFALRMADTVKDEPFIVSYLVRAACVQLAVQPVWEGLADHAWTDAQLQTLQTRLQQYDFVSGMQRPFDCERAAGALTVDLIRKKGLALLMDWIGPGQPTSMDRKFANWWGGFIPSGWYYQEQLNHLRLYELQLNGAYDAAKKRILPERVKANGHALEREISSGSLGKTVSGFLHHRVIAALFLPALSKIPAKAAAAQCAVDEAALACALERFRLANGSFPETLEALVPKFISQLPTDVITGQPHKYRGTEDGRFVLYSVGWDEKDGGGVSGKTLFDESEADWVWQYPAK